MPFSTPVPPSPDTSEALFAAFAERGIEFVSQSRVASLDAGRSVAVLEDGRELPFDLFLGVPQAPRAGRRHRERHDGERLCARELGDARDEVSRRVRGRGRRDGRRAEGRRLCRRRGARRRGRADREAPGRRATRRVWRARLVLRRVRRRTCRPRRHRLSRRDRSRPAPSGSRPPSWSRRSIISARAGEPVGSESASVSEAHGASIRTTSREILRTSGR